MNKSSIAHQCQDAAKYLLEDVQTNATPEQLEAIYAEAMRDGEADCEHILHTDFNMWIAAAVSTATDIDENDALCDGDRVLQNRFTTVWNGAYYIFTYMLVTAAFNQ